MSKPEPKKHFLEASGWGKKFLALLGEARSGDTIVATSKRQKDLCLKLKEQSPYSRKNLDITVEDEGFGNGRVVEPYPASTPGTGPK